VSSGTAFLSIAIAAIASNLIILLRGAVACGAPARGVERFDAGGALLDMIQAGVVAVALIAVTTNFSSSETIASINSAVLCTSSSCTTITSGSSLATAACALTATAAALLVPRFVLVLAARSRFIASDPPSEPLEARVPAITPAQIAAIKAAAFLIQSGQTEFLIASSAAMVANSGAAAPEMALPNPKDLYAVALASGWARPPPNPALVPMCIDRGTDRAIVFVSVDANTNNQYQGNTAPPPATGLKIGEVGVVNAAVGMV
jgi:hypothetical protein